MPFSTAQKGANLISTLENYSALQWQADAHGDIKGFGVQLYDDNDFWWKVLYNPDQFWNMEIKISGATVSDWVARVPGLYFTKGAEALRNVPNQYIEKIHSERWIQYRPIGKSQVVMGGIGTFILPPDDNGNLLLTASTSNNASTGIPILVSPEVMDHIKLKQGDIIESARGVWRKMSHSWANRFPSIKGIPRGYIVIDNPDNIRIRKSSEPVEIHPCSIMEYSLGNATLYDYIFCTVDTNVQNYRFRIEDFFERYRKENGRDGRYLIAADMNNPLFESHFNSPADLLRNDPGGKAQIELINERIRNVFLYKDETISSIIEKVSGKCATPDDIQVLCININAPFNKLQFTATAKMSIQLVELCIEMNKLEELVDQLVIQ